LKDSELYLDGIASKFRDKGIACKTLVAHGPVVEKIIEAASHGVSIGIFLFTPRGGGF
jgi:hypothetical protein